MSNPSPIIVQRDTRAWQLQVWVSFGIAVFLCGVGLAACRSRRLYAADDVQICHAPRHA